MADKVYVDIEIVEVVDGPEVDGKFFSAKCKVKGKDEAVKIKGYAKSKEGGDNTACIAAGKTIRATWSEEYSNYFTAGEVRKGGSGFGGGKTYAPRFGDTREGWIAQQRCIMAQNALGNAIQFMHGLPGDKAAENYTSEAATKLASKFFHALWADAAAGFLDAKPEEKKD